MFLLSRNSRQNKFDMLDVKLLNEHFASLGNDTKSLKVCDANVQQRNKTWPFAEKS